MTGRTVHLIMLYDYFTLLSLHANDGGFSIDFDNALHENIMKHNFSHK